MGQPALTAHLSLYRTSGHYQAVCATQHAGGIRPQQAMTLPPGFPVPNCGPCRGTAENCFRICGCPPDLPPGWPCDPFIMRCDPSECAPCGPCTCTKDCGGTAVPCNPGPVPVGVVPMG